MCDFIDFEMEKTRLKKKMHTFNEEWESEPELEKINQEEKPIEITK
ncbi:MAG: hypothetical protein ACTHJ2_04650 [Candidatus Nitrosocosmicus sp.]